MKKYFCGFVSLDRQYLTQALSGISGNLIENLIKLYLFKDSDNANHWRREVWNALHMVPSLKKSEKYNGTVHDIVTKDVIIRDIIGAYDDMTTELANLMIEEYPDLTPFRTDYDELSVIVNTYLDWISDVLSTKGVVTSSEVYAKLDELGL